MKTKLSAKLSSLVIFRNLLNLNVIKSFIKLDKTDPEDTNELLAGYGEFMSELFSITENFSLYVCQEVLNDENIYIKHKLNSDTTNDLYESMLTRELEILQELINYKGTDLKKQLKNHDLPLWQTQEINLKEEYTNRIKDIKIKGYGIFASHNMFVFDGTDIKPVKNPDPQKTTDLIGYQKERDVVITNTHAFISGHASNNILLYGDAGTGKSSTVKAVANLYADRGLRLIELKKDQLSNLPHIIEKLSNNPLKFIFFIDDLTFTSDDKNFCELKATLEGGVTKAGQNIIIYATSNHRHMVKELHSSREDSINTADVIEETSSLSARFGITVTFLKLDKEKYDTLVCELCKRAGVTNISDNDLITHANKFALRGGGRTPRTAKQFTLMMSSKVKDGRSRTEGQGRKVKDAETF